MHILISSLGDAESDDDESIFAAPDEDWEPKQALGVPVNSAQARIVKVAMSTDTSLAPVHGGNDCTQTISHGHCSQRSCSDTSISSIGSTFSSLSLFDTTAAAPTTQSSTGDSDFGFSFDHPQGDWLNLKLKTPAKPQKTDKELGFLARAHSTKVSSPNDIQKSRPLSIRPDFDLSRVKSKFSRKDLRQRPQPPSVTSVPAPQPKPVVPLKAPVVPGCAKRGPVLPTSNNTTTTKASTPVATTPPAEPKPDLVYIDKASLLFSSHPLFDTLPKTSKLFEIESQIAQMRKQATKLRTELAGLNDNIANKIEFYKHSTEQRTVMLNRQQELHNLLAALEKKRYETGLQLSRTMKQQRQYDGEDIWVRNR